MNYAIICGATVRHTDEPLDEALRRADMYARLTRMSTKVYEMQPLETGGSEMVLIQDSSRNFHSI